MFQWISILGFAGLFASILLHSLLFPCGYKPRFSFGALIRKKVHLFTLLFPEQKLGWPTKIRKFVFDIGLISFLVLLVTGFGPMLLGGHLRGYWLMIHATFAPVFIACAAFIAFTGAGQYAFNKKDAENIPCSCHKKEGKSEECWLTDTGVGAKAMFWFLLLMSLPLTLSMVLSMFPLFGTDGQVFLLRLHRICALVFSLASVLEIYMLIRMEVIKDVRN